MIELAASRGDHVERTDHTDGAALRRSRTLPAAIALPLLCAALAAGCGAGGNPAGAGTLITMTDTIAGVIQVMNSGAPPQWELRELLTVGSTGGLGAESADDEFGQLTGILADRDGLIYVADAQSYDIRVFDPEGHLLRRIGRQGSGPGEFGMLQSVGWIGDMLAALDPNNGRMGLLRADGEWVGHRPYAALTGDIRIYQTGPDELYMPMIGTRDSDGGGLVYIRQTQGGGADTLRSPMRVASGGERLRFNVVCRFQGGISFYSVNFAPKLVFSPAPEALMAQAWTADYQIAFTDAANDTVRLVARDLPPLPVTNEEWSAEEAKFREWREQYAGVNCEPARPSRPEARSFIREIFFDDSGNTWIERQTGGGWAYDVFDPAGRLLAEIPAPDRKVRVPPFVRGDRLYLITTDELDVEYVKVFAIEKG